MMKSLIEATNDAIIITTAHDLDRPGPRIVYVNPAFSIISGYQSDEVIGKSPRLLQGPGTDVKARSRIRTSLRAGRSGREEMLNYARDGRPYWLDIHIVPLLDDNGVLQYFGAIERDVTETRNTVDRLHRLAHEDVLTGLGNRAALHHHIDARCDAVAGPVTLLMFDLDGFKAVNDTLGHLAGDEILRLFAAQVVTSLNRDDFMARLGGDEFVVILKGYAPKQALDFAEGVLAKLAVLPVAGARGIGASVGIADLTPQDTLETVLARADAALYRAKAAGKGVARVSLSGSNTTRLASSR